MLKINKHCCFINHAVTCISTAGGLSLRRILENNTLNKTRITVAHGDGIGPEIMDATLRILEAAGARLEFETIEIGEKVYLSGNTSGIGNDAWDSLRRTRVFLKAPITTPQGGGFKSVNVTMRKSLGLFANVRPCVSYAPYVRTMFPNMDVVIVRENEEDLYAGIEHRQTQDTYQCLKLITRAGCEKIVRYAFEYAVQYKRKKVSCFSKDNIMKMTDGIFHAVFNEVGKEYPQIEKEHYIIDIGTARLATRPGNFDVIVTLNLYGDIISDVAAEICGSVGLAGSANIGESFAMFEAIHGSAPDIAGMGIANPSGLLQGAVQMLVHIGQTSAAINVQNAWLKTLEDGIHTADIYVEGQSREKVGTKGFADAVVARLGEKPMQLREAEFSTDARPIHVHVSAPVFAKKELVGIDVFLDQRDGHPNMLGPRVEMLGTEHLKLSLITNRGIKVYPAGHGEVSCADHWRCRFKTTGEALPYSEVIKVLKNFTDEGLEPIKTENLYTFNGERGYSLAQGE